MAFPCTGCGACCRKVGKWVGVARQLVADGNNEPLIVEVNQFPFEFMPDGSCSKLNPDNTCSVYDERPLVCNIEKTRVKYHSHMSAEKYNKYAAESCNAMINEAGLDKKFIVKIEPDGN